MNSNSQIDLDEKINLIYNFLYNKLDSSCFNISKINLKNISIDDIKIGLKHNEINEEILKYILKGRIQMVKPSENLFNTVTIVLSSCLTFDIHIEPYKNGDKIDSFLFNKDQLFSYILSELVLDEKTKHILLPIVNVDVKFSHIERLLKILKLYDYYNTLQSNDKIVKIFQ